nr:hypothetical protein BaRGS_004564 [Batillaria attramentaria]
MAAGTDQIEDLPELHHVSFSSRQSPDGLCTHYSSVFRCKTGFLRESPRTVKMSSAQSVLQQKVLTARHVHTGNRDLQQQLT